mgnify:CR=1 FL=1
MNIVDKLMAWESGDLEFTETLELFSELIKEGTAWQLQGSYGRVASVLIDNGYISKTGEILKTEWND